jgi:hypothetical protein
MGADTGSVFLQFSGWKMADTIAFEKNAKIFFLCVLSIASFGAVGYQNSDIKKKTASLEAVYFYA